VQILNVKKKCRQDWGYIMCFSVCYLFDVSLLTELYWHLGDITMNMRMNRVGETVEVWTGTRINRIWSAENSWINNKLKNRNFPTLTFHNISTLFRSPSFFSVTSRSFCTHCNLFFSSFFCAVYPLPFGQTVILLSTCMWKYLAGGGRVCCFWMENLISKYKNVISTEGCSTTWTNGTKQMDHSVIYRKKAHYALRNLPFGKTNGRGNLKDNNIDPNLESSHL
jgi:hypothetical protein